PDPTGHMKVLEVTDGNMIRSWEDEDLIEWFNTLNLFGWWNWFGSNSVQIYFDNQVNLEMVSNYIKNNHQKLRNVVRHLESGQFVRKRSTKTGNLFAWNRSTASLKRRRVVWNRSTATRRMFKET
ncbi:2592_t:CDS:2, partial [Gigaspora rosea]